MFSARFTALGRAGTRAFRGARFAATSSSSSTSEGAFGKTDKDAAIWLVKAAAVSGVLGFIFSEYVLTEKRLAKLKNPFLDEPQAFTLIDKGMHAHPLPWEHRGFFKTYDHAALRRGYQVYREICAACHSMNLIHWRNLVGVTHSEEEAKAMAAEYEYQDGPDDKGELFMRPGKLTDRMPVPYHNDESARVANGGALPPDLSCIARARHGEEDYIFNLLLGYSDPPAGFLIREGLHFNRYFPGGAIAMARAVYDEVVDYEDGTPNNASQIAKDVSTFLAWASYPEHDERKKMGMKAVAMSVAMLGLSIWWKRFKWSLIKSKKLAYRPSKDVRDV